MYILFLLFLIHSYDIGTSYSEFKVEYDDEDNGAKNGSSILVLGRRKCKGQQVWVGKLSFSLQTKHEHNLFC